MSDSLEVQVLRNALATEQRKTGVLIMRVAELSAVVAVREFELYNVTTSATALVKGLQKTVERLQHDLAARN
jgi:hypothetical protein